MQANTTTVYVTHFKQETRPCSPSPPLLSPLSSASLRVRWRRRSGRTAPTPLGECTTATVSSSARTRDGPVNGPQGCVLTIFTPSANNLRLHHLQRLVEKGRKARLNTRRRV